MPSSPVSSPLHSPITRRSLLGAAAGSAALLATRRLPAWARPVAFGAGLRQPESLPFPGKPAGTPSMPEIEHIVVVMMENHSFDNLLGMVPHQVPGRGSVDGLRLRGGRPVNSNPDANGNPVVAQHATSPCQLSGEPSQSWNASHESWDNGLNDGFVKASAPVAMRFWDKRDLPFTYSLVEHFPIGERYFCSVLGQTFPNRCYLFSGTSSGTINDTIAPAPPPNGTIWDRLDAHNISWGIYDQPPSYPSFELVPGSDTPARSATRVHTFSEFLCRRGRRAVEAVHVPRPELRDHLGGEPPGHPGRRALPRSGRERADQGPHVEEHRTDHQLRRTRRLLRPRAPAAGDRARLGGANARARRRPGYVRPLRLPRAADRRLTVGQARVRLARRPGPHLGPGVHRAQVEPAGDDAPRRQRPPDDRLLQLPQAGVPEAAEARRGAQATPGSSRVPGRRAAPAAQRWRRTETALRHSLKPPGAVRGRESNAARASCGASCTLE